MNPFLSHFSEIQARFFYSVFSYTITFFLSFCFSTEMIYLFTTPILSFEKPFLSTHLTEPLYATLQICSGIALLVVYPLLLFHLWSFLLSSLFSWERRRRNRSFQSSFFLFSLSLFFVYQFLIPLFLQFFFQFEIGEVSPVTSEEVTLPKTHLVPTSKEVVTSPVTYGGAVVTSEEVNSVVTLKGVRTREVAAVKVERLGVDGEVFWKERSSVQSGGVTPNGVKILIEPRIGPFVSWCFHIFFLFSLLSQAPLPLFYLYQRGILTPSLLFKNRRSALLFLVIGTSLLSPPDFWSQLFLLLLFFTIYEICIWFSFFLEGRRGSLDLSKFESL